MISYYKATHGKQTSLRRKRGAVMNEPELDLDVLARRLWQVTGQDPQAVANIIREWMGTNAH